MTKVIITGATGNVGREVMHALSRLNHNLNIYAGVRDVSDARIKLNSHNIQFLKFDFADLVTYETALSGCDILFLLRPPQLSKVEKYFKPLIETCVDKGLKHIIFLSVQGVEKSKIIPHHKIEKLIVDSKISYTFLRPAYFMQNFTTTLRADLVNKRLIYLPAGKVKFTLIDICDIGAVAAHILTDISGHKNRSYELTSKEKFTFGDIAEILSFNLDVPVHFKSPSLLGFFFTKREEKVRTALIFVMIMLHYFPRFQDEPEMTEWVEKILHRQPTTFQQFVKQNKMLLTEW